MFKSKQKLTDDEYVEKIRKTHRASRKMAVYFSVFCAIAFVVSCFLLQKLINSLSEMAQHKHEFNNGLGFGFMVGFSIAFIFFKLVKSLIDSVMMALGVHYSRTTRLMLFYYDLAQELMK